MFTFWPPGPVAARKLSLSASSGISTSSGRIAPLAEIVRERRSDVDRRFAVPRNEEARRVKEHRASGHSVDPVADNPAAERLARVRADLVRAARQRLKLDQSGPIARQRAFAIALSQHGHANRRPSSTPPPRSNAWQAGRRSLPAPPRLCRRPPQDSIFRRRCVSNAFWNSGARLGGAREQQAAAGIRVEPMHRRRRTFEAALQLVRAGDDRIAAAARRVDRQPGRLVEHDRFARR